MRNSTATFWPGTLRVPPYVVVGVVSLATGLQHGLNYALGNQTGYLLWGLQLFNPELFANDWLVSETHPYHPFFTYVAYLLYLITPNGLSFAVANVLTIALSCIVIYRIVGLLAEEDMHLPVFLVLMAFVSVTETWSVAVSFIFSKTFQPSSIASLTFLVGCHEYLRGRFLRSGLVLALGGLFHANFLMLGFPLFGISHLFLGKDKLFKRLLWQLGPSALAVIPLLPMIVEATLSPDAALGRSIFTVLHGPQHYAPRTFISQFYVFYAWHILGLIAGWKYLRQQRNKRVRVLFFTQLALITVASLLTTVVFVPAVSQLFVWRLAPFSVLFAQLIGCAGIASRFLSAQKHKISLRNVVLTFGMAVCVYVVWHSHYGWYRYPTLYLLVLVGAAFILSGLLRSMVSLPGSKRILYMWLASAVLWLYGGLTPFQDFVRKSNIISGLSEPEKGLYEWIHEHTEVDAVFLIPPGFEMFRLRAERAVVAEWKTTPVAPSDVVAWYRRMEVVSTRTNFKGKREVLQGYDTHNNESLSHVYEAYPYDFAIVYRKKEMEDFADYRIAYENDRWIVLASAEDQR